MNKSPFSALVIFCVWCGRKETKGEKTDSKSHSVQSLLLQFEQNAFSQNGQENAEKKILEAFESLLNIQCVMAEFGTESAKYLKLIKEQTMEICANEKWDQFAIQKLKNAIDMAFQKDGAKMVNAMKRGEHTVKVTVDGKYGTLAELLPKLTQLRPYWTAIKILRVISEQMDDGPRKKVIANTLKATTVIIGGNPTVMPSDLVALLMALWHVFSHEVTKIGKISGQIHSFEQVGKNDQQEISKRRGSQKSAANGQMVGNAIRPIGGQPLRRRRRNLHISARQLANLFHAMIVVIVALNLLRSVLRTAADQLDQPPIFMMVAVAATIRYFMMLD